MSIEQVGSGVVLGIGGSNARIATAEAGDIVGFKSIETPEHADEFFTWMSRQVLDAANEGSEWAVIGFPGPVSDDGDRVGPMVNINGLSQTSVDLKSVLGQADPASTKLFEEGFILAPVNDGELAAHAATTTADNNSYDTVAALIIGTGVGAGIVHKNPDSDNVYRADKSNPAEIGHTPIGNYPDETYESTISGPALERRYGQSPAEIDSYHAAWVKVGKIAGQISLSLGLNFGVEYVAITGGVGATASKGYGKHLDMFLNSIKEHGNATQKHFLPTVRPVPVKDAQIFEMYGGEGVMRDIKTRQ